MKDRQGHRKMGERETGDSQGDGRLGDRPDDRQEDGRQAGKQEDRQIGDVGKGQQEDPQPLKCREFLNF